MKKLLSIIFLSSLLIGNQVLAEDFVCAAVYPCDEDGNLLKEYDDAESPCLDYYIGQCLVLKLEISKHSLQACEFQKSELEATVSALDQTEKKYQKLKRKLRALRGS